MKIHRKGSSFGYRTGWRLLATSALGTGVAACWLLGAGCSGCEESTETSTSSVGGSGTGGGHAGSGAGGVDAHGPLFPGTVWALAETRHLLRDAPAADATSVDIAAARDEWESFQIFVRAEQEVSGVDVVAGELVGPEGYVIGGDEIALFREHQLEITVGSYRNEAFQPGWYPDPLIPFVMPTSASQLVPPTYQAVPFDLPADETHGFWVDIHVPVDAPAGDYEGSFFVRASEGTTEISAHLTVWNFTLPRLATLKTALGWPPGRMRSYYEARAAAGIEPEPEDWEGVDLQAAELLSTHRINCRPPSGMYPDDQGDGTFLIPTEDIERVRAYVDQFHVNALSVPNPSSIFDAPGPELDAWLAAWDEAIVALDRPDVVFYIYLRDEPNDQEAYEWVRTWGTPIVAAQSLVQVLVVEQPEPQDAGWGNLYGAVDIWCPLFPIFEATSAAARQELGETIWTYTALAQRTPPTPWWHTDHPLLNYRVPAWTSWTFGIRGLLYWGGMAYWDQVDDPWTDPATFVREDNDPVLTYNGEGTIIYPGRAVGYDGIAPSMRLKALRDSIEDYEYLSILERGGLSADARTVVTALTPSWFEWNADPAAYETARAALAAQIVDAGLGR